MTIKREDIDNRQMGFSGVATGRRLSTVHPGEILRDEFLKTGAVSRSMTRRRAVPSTTAGMRDAHGWRLLRVSFEESARSWH